MLKKLILLLAVCLLLSFAAFAETAAGPADTSVPASAAADPAPTADPATGTDLATESDLPPVLVNRIADPTLTWTFPEDAELLEIWFPKIRDCDAALIRCGGENVLIDCCSRGQSPRLAALLELTQTTELKAIYNSHPHNDHILGFETVTQMAQVDMLGICFNEYYTDHMVSALRVARRAGIPIVHYEDGYTFTVGGAQVQTWLKGDIAWELNDQSAVMRLQYGDRSILFTGDIGTQAEERLVSVLPEGALQSDILKYPHHGVRVLLPAFREAVDPELCVITNIYDHRSKKVRRDLDMNGIAYAFTDSDYIHLVTDGSVWVAEVLQETDFPGYQTYVNDATMTDLNGDVSYTDLGESE